MLRETFQMLKKELLSEKKKKGCQTIYKFRKISLMNQR